MLSNNLFLCQHVTYYCEVIWDNVEKPQKLCNRINVKDAYENNSKNDSSTKKLKNNHLRAVNLKLEQTRSDGEAIFRG